METYADGSKLFGKIERGIFFKDPNTKLSNRFPEYCNVFLAEVMIILKII